MSLVSLEGTFARCAIVFEYDRGLVLAGSPVDCSIAIARSASDTVQLKAVSCFDLLLGAVLPTDGTECSAMQFPISLRSDSATIKNRRELSARYCSSFFFQYVLSLP